ncbi:MAG: luxA 1 [Rhizobium sp.]|nr:luxA 1 [Rhizobium sp.]
MELGVYSFGDVQRDTVTGKLGSTAEATRNLLEAIQLADQVGLDYFGIGEHHTREMPASAAAVVLGAAASTTKNIKLGSAVTVLSTDDPVRVYQQFATLDALSNGRAEITAGRGSSTESFPLFGHSLNDYDELYAEKLDLLLKINESESITWSGKHRPALDNALVVPRPESGSLPIWLATGGNPQSSVRAGLLGLPISYAIIGGQAARFAPLAELYRRAAAQGKFPEAQMKISVASPGYVGDDAKRAKEQFWVHWHAIMETIGKVRGFAPPRRRRSPSASSRCTGAWGICASSSRWMWGKCRKKTSCARLNYSAPASSRWSTPNSEQTTPSRRKVMRATDVQTIGILGAGRVGTALARRAIAAGYEVRIATSKPPEDIALLLEIMAPGAKAGSVEAVIDAGDIVVLALPLSRYRALQADLFEGKIVVDVMNYWAPTDGTIVEFEGQASSSEVIQDYLPGARLVRSFNHMGYHEIDEEARLIGHPDRRALALAGNDPQARAVVADFIDRLGFDPVDAGELAASQGFATGTPVFGATLGRETMKQLLREQDAYAA